MSALGADGILGRASLKAGPDADDSNMRNFLMEQRKSALRGVNDCNSETIGLQTSSA